jgi:hypothetical protein
MLSRLFPVRNMDAPALRLPGYELTTEPPVSKAEDAGMTQNLDSIEEGRYDGENNSDEADGPCYFTWKSNLNTEYRNVRTRFYVRIVRTRTRVAARELFRPLTCWLGIAKS